MGKNTSLISGAVVRGGDDFSGGIAAGGVGMGFFVAPGALRDARHGRAPNCEGARAGPEVSVETLCARGMALFGAA